MLQNLFIKRISVINQVAIFLFLHLFFMPFLLEQMKKKETVIFSVLSIFCPKQKPPAYPIMMGQQPN